MRTCPRCRQDVLLELVDGSSGFRENVCSSCGYYESDSPAYATIPEMFRSLGFEVLRRVQRQIGAYGLTDCEARAWRENEPDFTKRIVTPINSKRTKRRRDVTLRNNIYISLLLLVTKYHERR
jgi:hypothetical protein